MSSEIGLNTRTNNISAVFNIPNGYSVDKFEKKFLSMLEALNALGVWYCAIHHNKDINKEGDLKRLHIHCVFIVKNRPRLSTFLYMLGSYLEYDSLDLLNTISLQKCNDLSASIQYLTHKNDINKYQYNASDILTNLPSDTFDEYYNKSLEADIISVQQLVNYIVNGYSNTQIMSIIGLGRYSLYKKCIDDIRKDFLNNTL